MYRSLNLLISLQHVTTDNNGSNYSDPSQYIRTTPSLILVFFGVSPLLG